MRSRRLRVTFVIATALVIAACSGSPPAPRGSAASAPTAPYAPVAAADPSAISSAAPSLQSTAPPASTPIPIWTGIENEVPGAPGRCAAKPCEFTAATYQTYGPEAFLPGLTTFIPDGWRSTEQDDGEFNLLNPDFPDSGLLLWLDVVPVAPDGAVVKGVPSTVAGLTGWFRANPQLVVTEPVEATIGKGLRTTMFVVDVADGAVNMDPGCDKKPTSPSCFPILTDPAHWGNGAWWVSALHRTRYYLADIGPATDRHLLVVAVVGSTMNPGPHVAADPAAELQRFEKVAAPILDSLDISRVTFN